MIEKYWDGCVQKLQSQGEWMDEWMELIFCMLIHGVRKAKNYTLGVQMAKYGCDLLGPGTLKAAMSQK